MRKLTLATSYYYLNKNTFNNSSQANLDVATWNSARSNEELATKERF